MAPSQVYGIFGCPPPGDNRNDLTPRLIGLMQYTNRTRSFCGVDILYTNTRSTFKSTNLCDQRNLFLHLLLGLNNKEEMQIPTISLIIENRRVCRVARGYD